MVGQPVELTGAIPNGWISVEPKVVNDDSASMVLLRTADRGASFVTNMTVTERVIGTDEDLAALAESYRQGLVRRAANVVVERQDVLSASPPRQFAQELRFTITVEGRDLDIKQSQFLFELPTQHPDKLVLLQLLYTAPVAVYDSAKSAVVEFMASITAQREESSSQNNAAQGADQSIGVRKENLEVRIKEILEDSVGRQVDEVVCNGGLRAEVGAVQRCALSVGGQRLGVTVRASSVDGGNIKLDIQIDDKPMV